MCFVFFEGAGDHRYLNVLTHSFPSRRSSDLRRPPVLYVENNHRGRSPELVRRLFDLEYRCFWHTTSYFKPYNHDGVDRNVFERPFELNMVCVPKTVAHLIEGMKEVASPDDWPLDG